MWPVGDLSDPIDLQGGEDHGVPIVVSALKPSGPAERSGQVHVGDTMLSVNGISLQQVRHVTP